MENLNPAEVLKFLEFVNNLKHLPRRGWHFTKVDNHESISGKTFNFFCVCVCVIFYKLQ